MLKLSELNNETDMMMEINSNTVLKDMKVNNNPIYSEKDIEGFVSSYNTDKSEAIGVLFVAESLNKNGTEAYYHFVAINMNTNEVLFSERLRGVSSGIGLRNYWAGSIYSVIKDIKRVYYKKWKRRY